MDKHVITIGDLPKLTMIARVVSSGVEKQRWTELAVYHRDHPSRPWVGVVEGRSSIKGDKVRFKHITSGTLDRVMAWFEGGALTERLAEAVERHAMCNGVNQALEQGRPVTEDQAIEQAVKDAIEHGVLAGVGQLAGQIVGTAARTSGNTVTENATEFFKAGRGQIGGDRTVVLDLNQDVRRTDAFGYRGPATLASALAWLYPDEQGSRSRRFEADFSIPRRTVDYALAVEAGEQGGRQGPWVQAIIATLRFFDRDEWSRSKEKQS